jgi:hypothetical protein
MESQSKHASHWLVPAALVSAILTAALVTHPRPAVAFARDGVLSGFESIHARITRNALPFMTDSVLNTIVAGNLDEDEDGGTGAEDDARRHGVNCRFRDSADYINMRYQQVVDALRAPQANDPRRAARLFGHLLHGLQDFYSHSNWIPTPPQGLGIRGRLLDAGLGLWPRPEPYLPLFDDVVVIEGDPPPGVSVRLPADANGRVTGAVPIVQDERIFGATANGRQWRGLMTSGAPREPGNRDQFCPPVGTDCLSASPEDVCLRHGEERSADTRSRNFDGAGRMNLDNGGGGDWFAARHHAQLQTEHEWCRLLHLSGELDPTFVASGRLLGNWVDMDETPHIPGTPCDGGPARPHRVVIEATPGRRAPLSVPFVLFRSDFTSSTRIPVIRHNTRTLQICADSGEDIVAALIPARTQGAKLVVPVPDTARSWTVRDHRGAFDVSYKITVKPNDCVPLPPPDDPPPDEEPPIDPPPDCPPHIPPHMCHQQ